MVERLGKTASSSEDFPAFIVNRILMPMINEAIYTLYEGVGSVKSIDTSMKLGANHPMGPFELADFIGLDTCLAIMNVLHDGLADTKYRPCPLLTKYVEAGWLGARRSAGSMTTGAKCRCPRAERARASGPQPGHERARVGVTVFHRSGRNWIADDRTLGAAHRVDDFVQEQPLPQRGRDAVGDLVGAGIGAGKEYRQDGGPEVRIILAVKTFHSDSTAGANMAGQRPRRPRGRARQGRPRADGPSHGAHGQHLALGVLFMREGDGIM